MEKSIIVLFPKSKKSKQDKFINLSIKFLRFTKIYSETLVTPYLLVYAFKSEGETSQFL